MANSDNAFGFRPVRYLSGLPYNGAANKYYVPASDSTALYLGDPVIIAGSADANGVPTVTRATAGSGGYVTGVVVGVDQVEGMDTINLGRIYRPASTGMYVWVADDPLLVFQIQEDSTGGALAATNVGQNADFAIGSGSSTTGLSAAELDSSTAATTNTLQCHILRLAPLPDNEIGTNAVWEIRFNLHTFHTQTTGI